MSNNVKKRQRTSNNVKERQRTSKNITNQGNHLSVSEYDIVWHLHIEVGREPESLKATSSDI